MVFNRQELLSTAAIAAIILHIMVLFVGLHSVLPFIKYKLHKHLDSYGNSTVNDMRPHGCKSFIKNLDSALVRCYKITSGINDYSR